MGFKKCHKSTIETILFDNIFITVIPFHILLYFDNHYNMHKIYYNSFPFADHK